MPERGGEEGEPDLGWVAPVYGAVVPSTTLRIVRQGYAPFALATIFVEAADAPALEWLEVRSDGALDPTAIAVRLRSGEVTETVRALRADGFDGFFSLEPHLGDTSSAGAWSGPELFTQAWKAFTDLLTREGIAYA